MAVVPESLKEIVGLHTTFATETANPSVDLPGAPRGSSGYSSYKVRIQYWNARHPNGSGMWTFNVLISYDNGRSWVPNVSGAAISTNALDGQQVLNVNPNLPTDTGRIMLTVIAMLDAKSGTPQLAYRADILLP